MTTDIVTAEQITPGQTLPELSVDVQPVDVVLGAMASRDWRPQHHDYKFATERNGVQDIFMNTPNLAAWFERYITDWTGPTGRLGWIRFRMKDSVFPGEAMVFQGTVKSVETDDAGCAWAEIEIQLTAGGRLANVCTARVAIPAQAGDNPWTRSGDAWAPRPSA